jgi:hypothetical protein
MKSYISPQFRDAYLKLPARVRQRARQAHRLFLRNPSHPSLNFKKVDAKDNIYSVRVTMNYRALGQLDGGEIVWFWIGPHAEYDKRV